MSGISDLPFRLINRSLGCGFAFTEMISANSLIQKSGNTLKMLSSDMSDRPLGVQILGGSADIIKRALDFLSEYDFDIIDFNAACPVNKVVSKGEGAALLKEPERLQKILKEIVNNSNVPVTVKIRSGWDDTSVNAVETALRARDAGVKAIFIHGRTRAQGYSGTVDYDIISEVKKSAVVPVVASGDALSPALIGKMFDETGCDGVVVARGALGNPWIFRATVDLPDNVNEPPGPDLHEITGVMKKHLDLNIAHHGEKTGVIHFRKFFGWYTKGLAVKKLKCAAFRASTGDEMLRLIEKVRHSAAGRAMARCVAVEGG
jgi:tRNA-dihydrouridine synthase B